MDISDYIAAAALVVSLAGVVYTHVQVRRSHTTQRAKLVKELHDELFDQEEFAYIYSLLERDTPLFHPDRGAPDPAERDRRQRGVERLLSKLEGICGLYKAGLLELQDLGNFDFNIRRISQAPGFSDYRRFLEDEWPKLRKLNRGPYADLFWYLDSVPPIKQ